VKKRFIFGEPIFVDFMGQFSHRKLSIHM